MKTLLLFVSAFIICTAANAQIITTIAGNGVLASNGNGGQATAAAVGYPWGICKDAAGNLYVTDRFGNCVRQISPSGIISTFAGPGTTPPAPNQGNGGPAISATLYGPAGITIDHSGNMFIANAEAHNIRKINTSGIITRVAGTAAGYFSYNGDGIPATSANLGLPYSAIADVNGEIYICDGVNSRIRKVSTTGIISTIAGNGGFIYSGDGGPATNAAVNSPSCIKMNKAGNLIICDFGNKRIRKINTAGIISTIAGNGLQGYTGDGGPATAAQIGWPQGVDIDTNGNIYFIDCHNSCVRKIDTTGIISTIAGTGIAGYNGDNRLATTAMLNTPFGIYIDMSGNIYISDVNNERVRVIRYCPPHFINGRHQSLVLCNPVGAAYMDYQLAIIDSDNTQTEHWQLLTPPAHGTALTSYTTAATGGGILPAGLSYTPGTGYIGTDSFSVVISDGLATDTTTIVVTIWPATPPLSISGTSLICVGTTVTLSGNPVGGVWSSSNPGVAAITATGSVSAIAAGSSGIIYKIVNACVTDSAIFPVTTVTSIAPVINVSSSADTICQGQPVIFTAAATYPGFSPNYQWIKNGIPTGATTTSYNTTSLANGDNVYCNMTSSIVCAMPAAVQSNIKTITVKDVLHPQIAITATPLNICDGTTATLTAHPTLGGTMPQYQWRLGGLPAGTASSYTYIPGNGDYITCTLISNYAFQCPVADSATTAITMYTVPPVTPAIAVTVSGNDSVDYLYEHIFFAATVTYEGSSPTYQWYENGTAVTGATSATYDVWLASSDTVYCMVTSSLECVTSPTATSNTVIVKGDYLSIADQHMPTANVRIYPNPSNGQFSIITKSPLSEEGIMTIYNAAGIRIKDSPITTNTAQQINVDVPPGIYQIRLTTPHLYWNGKITITP